MARASKPFFFGVIFTFLSIFRQTAGEEGLVCLQSSPQAMVATSLLRIIYSFDNGEIPDPSNPPTALALEKISDFSRFVSLGKITLCTFFLLLFTIL